MRQNHLDISNAADVISFSYKFSEKHYPDSPDAPIKVQRMIFEFRPSHIVSIDDTEGWLIHYWPRLQ